MCQNKLIKFVIIECTNKQKKVCLYKVNIFVIITIHQLKRKTKNYEVKLFSFCNKQKYTGPLLYLKMFQKEQTQWQDLTSIYCSNKSFQIEALLILISILYLIYEIKHLKQAQLNKA